MNTLQSTNFKTEAVILELGDHYQKLFDLGFTAQSIIMCEMSNGIIDLETGAIFSQAPDWLDFSERWAAERTRCHKPLDTMALSIAIMRAAQPAVTPQVATTLANVCIRRLRDLAIDAQKQTAQS